MPAIGRYSPLGLRNMQCLWVRTSELPVKIDCTLCALAKGKGRAQVRC